MRRVLLKLSGALFGEPGTTLSPRSINRLVEEIVEGIEGVQLGIVVGGGNIVRGREAKLDVDRATLDYMGMLATVINALALQSALEARGLATRVLSAIEVNRVAEPFIRRRALRHLEKGRVVIFAGGTGNPYFSTDTAAALRAAEIGAELLLKATNVDGVYTEDPRKNPNARLLGRISYMDFITRQLGVMDVSAVQLAKENDLPILVFNVGTPGNLTRALRGESVGTLISKEG